MANEKKKFGLEEGLVVFLFLVIVLYFISIIKGIRAASKLSGDDDSPYEAKDIFGGMKVIKVDCYQDKIPTNVPAGTVAYCMNDWEWLEESFRKFYKAREDFERAKKTKDLAKMKKAREEVIDKGWALNSAIAVMNEGDSTWWFIRINEIILNLDNEINDVLKNKNKKK